MDFEFLGNTSGNPVTLQTNLTSKFLCRWFVDNKVIRVFHNVSNETGVPYPVGKPLAIQCSIWDGGEWATQGGRVKLNYSYAPFVVHYEGFDGVHGCQACPASPVTACDNKTEFPECYDSDKYWFLHQEEPTKRQIEQLKKHHRKYIVYDYCQDRMRFPSGLPDECQFNSY
ncbi:xyloglucan endotransglucosylase protein 6-like [Physcomitrium patens]|uniref:xyloglucan endotransglucosylase protein 6-like n=1 Tax=Physcomitrium patens TaxID=3218 RepID=UPI003CCD5814